MSDRMLGRDANTSRALTAVAVVLAALSLLVVLTPGLQPAVSRFVSHGIPGVVLHSADPGS